MTTQTFYPRDLRAVDEIGTKWVSVDIKVDRVTRLEFGTKYSNAGWIPGPTIPKSLWRDYQRAEKKYRRLAKKYCHADEKATVAYKSSRYIIVNGLYGESFCGAKYETWLDRMKKWEAVRAPLHQPMQQAEQEWRALLEQIADYNSPAAA